jgi:hypothetical protein
VDVRVVVVVAGFNKGAQLASALSGLLLLGNFKDVQAKDFV